MYKPKILTTLGPASLNGEIIKKLSDRNVDFFRINMSHTSIEQLKNHIKTIRKFSDTPICIDSEGAQVRTGLMPNNTIFNDRQKITLFSGNNSGTSSSMGLWPSIVFAQLRPGMILTVDFDSVLLSILSVKENTAEALVLNGGRVGENKAVTLFPSVSLPALSEKDIKAFRIGLDHDIRDFALSFANSADDVLKVRSIVGKDSNIISKIESKNGVLNLDNILKVTDSILIDRGDLSREIQLENIPFLQKMIIKKGTEHNKNVYVATNLLESMMVNGSPTRAELNDVINTLIDGATGLVLAAETAVGNYPVATVDILRSLISCYTNSLSGYDVEQLLERTSYLLPKMHGSKGERIVAKNESIQKFQKNIKKFKTLEIDECTYLDVLQIAQNVYSPLKGFMGQDDLDEVLDNYRLADGSIWTLPIILQIDKEKWETLNTGITIVLKYKHSPQSQIFLKVNELFKIDLDSVSQKWFGTTDLKHPGVARFMKLGPFLVSGQIHHSNYEQALETSSFLTPEQTRMIFSIKGWSRVVAFHTRNVPHKAHEYLMNEALKKCNADGLLIQPVIGPKKSGDFNSDVILGAYNTLIESSFPRAIVSTFATYPRYSGPREAVFTALCRKNYGCTHFIVGRDHTGVGEYYKNISNSDLFNQLGDIGIKIIFFEKVGYNKSLKKIVEKDKNMKEEDFLSISGTNIRNALLNGEKISEKFIRKEIVDYLLKFSSEKKDLFVI